MIQITDSILPELAKKHWEAIDAFFNRTRNNTYKYTSIRMAKLNTLLGGKEGIKKVVLATPQELKELVDAIGVKKVDKSDALNTFVNFYTSFLCPSKTNEKWEYNLSEALTKLGIHVCPYCNSNYVHKFDSDDGLRRTYQFDHFFSKDDYPYLAISFYNLIPSCGDCNVLKGVKPMIINPYDLSQNLSSSFKFRFKINKADVFKRDPNVVSIDYTHDAGFEDPFKLHDNAIYLKQRYEQRRDLVLEAIHKKQMYSDEYIEQLYDKYKGTIFTSKEDVMRYVSGNYVTDEGFLKRPFSKLNKDIWEQLDE